MNIKSQLQHAVETIKQGGLIVYPTESVYGLGCDPFNRTAVSNLLALKRRPVEKGLILIASHIRQVLPLIAPKEPNDLARALKTWPGHFTWVFPKSALVPHWISGAYDSVAIRISQHPSVVALCNELNCPLVSTSVNLSNSKELTSIKAIKLLFGDKIHSYLDTELGSEDKPSEIRDAHTLKLIR